MFKKEIRAVIIEDFARQIIDPKLNKSNLFIGNIINWTIVNKVDKKLRYKI